MVDKVTRKVLLQGRLHNGLYQLSILQLSLLSIQKTSSAFVSVSSSTHQSTSQSSSPRVNSASSLWHRRVKFL
ncbi:hypothetical protein TorRG33x02_001550 [Trema orientale]|uniref:Uncharacterized protein n=1 Tax=Trema orientale TaxID=63057 RepID=A0A2P5G1F6_TREOI|nr:hypothetical protein TorRG33x02_001550 [Trema orientale]